MLRKRFAIGLGGAGLLLVLALAILFALTGSSGDREAHSKFATDPDAVRASGRDSPGESPIGGYEAYLSAERTYPADVIPPAVVENARATFDKIASQGDNSNGNNRFQPFGPLQTSTQPGVTSFTGATNTTSSRDTAIVIAPTCVAGNCRIWVGSAGGGVWRTDDALAANPTWTWLNGGLALNSVGSLVADPNDPTGNTLYLGTGEANRCSSGCESGVGIYKTTDGGNNWTKLADSCVSNTTYSCVELRRRFSRPRDQQDRGRSDEPETHLRRICAGCSRAFARDR